jgi:hypothetical protein
MHAHFDYWLLTIVALVAVQLTITATLAAKERRLTWPMCL